jgi:Protein of unknown function (DUF664)
MRADRDHPVEVARPRYAAPMTVAIPEAALARTEPTHHTGERRALEEWVDFHRGTLLTKCQGLTAAQLKTPSAPPSVMTLLGLVRHMTLVERWWFQMHAAQLDVPFIYTTNEWENGDFEDLEGADAQENLLAFVSECERSRVAVADVALDDVVRGRGEQTEFSTNVRWIFVHMIEEYARHNGHADLLRERIDGATGE